jgi:hypothetical protein
MQRLTLFAAALIASILAGCGHSNTTDSQLVDSAAITFGTDGSRPGLEQLDVFLRKHGYQPEGSLDQFFADRDATLMLYQAGKGTSVLIYGKRYASCVSIRAIAPATADTGAVREVFSEVIAFVLSTPGRRVERGQPCSDAA